MALTVSFTAASVSGSPESILFTDTSTGSDSSVVSRRIYVANDVGEFLVEDGSSLQYSLWPLPLVDTITLDLLSFDISARITVQWLDVNDAILYTSTINAIGFTEFNENFDFSLIQMLTGNPMLINDNNFWDNKQALRTYIDSGNQAILMASDLYNAQQCYNAATNLRLNSQYYFNENS